MILSINNLSISYDNKLAIDDISFEVDGGTALGILGSNGAGKSSTLKVLAGVLSPTKGSIMVNGYSMTDFHEANEAKMITGYCPDVGGLIPQATLREHIDLTLSLHNRLDMWPAAMNLVRQYDLENEMDVIVAGYSHGMSRRASVILATLSSSKLLILDEPFDGVDRLGTASVTNTIARARDAGLAVIVSTHLQSLLAQATDKIMVMSKGKILTTEPSENFIGPEGEKHYEEILAQAGMVND